jgi:hypothetical protein
MHFIKDDFDKIVEDTPVEILWHSGLVHESPFVLSHVSDVLRFALLFKFGGTYFDSGTSRTSKDTWKRYGNCTKFLHRSA